METNKILIDVDYEEPGGYFDKDEQGWCCSRTAISCTDGETVVIRKYYDANGIIRSDYSTKGKIVEIRNERIVIIYVNENLSYYYSIAEKKLVDL